MAHNARRKRERLARKTRKTATYRSKKWNFKFVRFLKRRFFIFICGSKQQDSSTSLSQSETSEKMSYINTCASSSSPVDKTEITKIIWKGPKNSSNGGSNTNIPNLTNIPALKRSSKENVTSKCLGLKRTSSSINLHADKQKQLEKISYVVMPAKTVTPKVIPEGKLIKSQNCCCENLDNVCRCFQDIKDFHHKNRKLKDFDEEQEVIFNIETSNNPQVIQNDIENAEGSFNSIGVSSHISERIPTFINLSIRDLYAQDPNFEKNERKNQKCKQAVQWWCDLGVTKPCTEKIEETTKNNATDSKEVFDDRKTTQNYEGAGKEKKMEPYKSLLTIPCEIKVFPSNIPNKLMTDPVERKCPPIINRYCVPQNTYRQTYPPFPGESYKTTQIGTSLHRSSMGQYTDSGENVYTQRSSYRGSVGRTYWESVDERRRSSSVQHGFPDIDFEIFERRGSRNITRIQEPLRYTAQYHPRSNARQLTNMPYRMSAVPRNLSRQFPVPVRNPCCGRYATAANRLSARRYSSRTGSQDQRHYQWQRQSHMVFLNQMENNLMRQELSLSSGSGSCVSDSSFFTEESFNFQKSSSFEDEAEDSTSDHVSSAYSEVSDISSPDENLCQGCTRFETARNFLKPGLVVSSDEKHRNEEMELIKYNNNSNNSASTDSGSSSTPSSYIGGTFHSFINYNMRRTQQRLSLKNTQSPQSNPKANMDILNLLLYDSYSVPTRMPLINKDFLLYYTFIIRIKVIKHRAVCVSASSIQNALKNKPHNDTTYIPKISTSKVAFVSKVPAIENAVAEPNKTPAARSLEKSDETSKSPVPNLLTNASLAVPMGLSSIVASSTNTPVKNNFATSAEKDTPVPRNKSIVSAEKSISVFRQNSLASVEQNISVRRENSVTSVEEDALAPRDNSVAPAEPKHQEMEWYSQVAVLRYKSQVSAFIGNLVAELMHSKRSSKQKAKIALIIKHSIETILEPSLAKEILQSSAFNNVSTQKGQALDSKETEGAPYVLLQITEPKIKSFTANLLHDEIAALSQSEQSLIVPFIRSLLEAILHKQIASKVTQKLDKKLNPNDASRIYEEDPDSNTIPLGSLRRILDEHLEKAEANKVYQQLVSKSASSWNPKGDSRQQSVPVPLVNQTVVETLQPRMASQILKKVLLYVTSRRGSKEISRSTSLSLVFVKNLITETVDTKTAAQIMNKIYLKIKEQSGFISKSTVALPIVKDAIQEVLEPGAKKKLISHQLQGSSMPDSIASLIQESLFPSPTIYSTMGRFLSHSEPSNTFNRQNNSTSIAKENNQKNKNTNGRYETLAYEMRCSRQSPIDSQKTDAIIPIKTANVFTIVEKRSNIESVAPFPNPVAPRNVKIIWTSKRKGSSGDLHNVESEDLLDLHDIEESDLRANKDYQTMLKNNSYNICWCFQGVLDHKERKLKGTHEETEAIKTKMTNNTQLMRDDWWCDLGVNSRTKEVENNAVDNKKVINVNRKIVANNEKQVKAKSIQRRLEPYKSLLTIPGKTKLFPFDIPNKLMPFLYPVNPAVRQCPPPRSHYYVPQNNRYPQITQLSRGDSYRTSQIRTSPHRSAIKKYPNPREKEHTHQPSYAPSVRSIYWGDTNVRRRSSFLQHRFPEIDFGIPENARFRTVTPNQAPQMYRERPVHTERTPAMNNARRYTPPQITGHSQRPPMPYHMGAVPRQTVPGQRETIPKKAVSRQVVSRQTPPRQAVPNQGVPRHALPRQTVPNQAVPRQVVPRQDLGQVPVQIRNNYGGRYASASPRRYSNRSDQRPVQWQQQHRMMLANQIQYNHMCQEFPSISKSCVSDSSFLTDDSEDLNFKKSSSFDDGTQESGSHCVSGTYFEVSDASFMDENPRRVCICFETGTHFLKPGLVASSDGKGRNKKIEFVEYIKKSNNSSSIDSGSSSTSTPSIYTTSSYTGGKFHSLINYDYNTQASSLINKLSSKSNRKTNKDILNILLYDSYTVPAREQLKNKDFLLYYMFITKIKIFKHRSTQCIEGPGNLDTTELCCTFTKIVISKSTNQSTIGTPMPQIADAEENASAVVPKAIKCACKKSKIPVPCNRRKRVKALRNEPHSDIIYIPKVLSSSVASSSRVPVRKYSIASVEKNIPASKLPVQINTEYDYEIALDNMDAFEYEKEEQEEVWHSQVAVLRYKSQVSAFIEDLVKQVMQPKSPLHSKRSSKQKTKLLLLIKHLIEQILEPSLASEILRNLDLDNASIAKEKKIDTVEAEGAAQILLQIHGPNIRSFMADLLHNEIAGLSQSEHYLIIPFIRSLLDAILHKQIASKVEQKLQQKLSTTDNLYRQRSISLTFVQKLIAEELNNDIASLVLTSCVKHSAVNVSEDKNKLVSLAYLNEALKQKLKPEIASEIFHQMELESTQLMGNDNEHKSLSLTYIKNLLEEVLKPKAASKVLKNLSKKSSLDNSGDSDKNRSIPFSTVKEVVKQTVKPEEADQVFRRLASGDYEEQKFVPLQSVKDALERKVESDVALEIIQALLVKSVTLQNVSVESVKEVVKQNLNPNDASRILKRIDEEYADSVIEGDGKATIPLETIKNILEKNLDKADANKVYQKLSSKNISSWRFRRGSRQQSVSVPFVKQTVESTLQPQAASQIMRRVSLDVASRRYSEELSRSTSLPLPFVKDLIMETVDPKTASQILNKISSKTKENSASSKNTVPLPVVKEAIQEVLQPDAKMQSSILHKPQESSTSDSVANLIHESIFSSPTMHSTNGKSLVTPKPSNTFNRRDNNKLSSISEENGEENKELSDHKSESVEYELLSSRLRPIASQKTDVVIPLQKANVLEVVEERSDTDSVPPVLEPLAPRNIKIMGTTKKRGSGGDMHNAESEEFLELNDGEEPKEREDKDYEKMLNELINKDRYFYTITGIPKERPQEPENLGKFYKEPFDYSGCVSEGNYEPVFDCIDSLQCQCDHEKPLPPTDLVESGSKVSHISSVDDMEKYLHGIDHNGVINPEFFNVVKQEVSSRDVDLSGMPAEGLSLVVSRKFDDAEKDDPKSSVSELEFANYKYFGSEILNYSISSIPADADFEPFAHNINSFRFLAGVSASESKAFIDILKRQLEEEEETADCCNLECALIEETERTYSQFKDISASKEISPACLVRCTYTISSQTEMDEDAKYLTACYQPLLLQLSCNCGCPDAKYESQLVSIRCSCPCDENKRLSNSKALIFKSQDANLSTQTQTSRTAFIKSEETQTGVPSVVDGFKKTGHENILNISSQNFSNTGIQTYAPLVPVTTTRGTMTMAKRIKSKCTCHSCKGENGCRVCESDTNAEYSYTCSCTPYHTYKNVHYKSGTPPYENIAPPFKFETHVHVTPSPCIPPQQFSCHGPSPYFCIPFPSYSTEEGSNTFHNSPEQNNPSIHHPALYTIPEENVTPDAHNSNLANGHASFKAPHRNRQSYGDVSDSTSEHISWFAPLSVTTDRISDNRNSTENRSRDPKFSCLHIRDFCSNGEPRCSNKGFNIGNGENDKGFRFDFSCVKRDTSARGLSDSRMNEQPFRFKAAPQHNNGGNGQSNSFKLQIEQNRNSCPSQCAQSPTFQQSKQKKSPLNLHSSAKERSQQSRQLVSANASQTDSAHFGQNNKSTATSSQDKFQLSPEGYINFIARSIPEANGLSPERRKHFERIADAYNRRINTPDAETSSNIQNVGNSCDSNNFPQRNKEYVKESNPFNSRRFVVPPNIEDPQKPTTEDVSCMSSCNERVSSSGTYAHWKNYMCPRGMEFSPSKEPLKQHCSQNTNIVDLSVSNGRSTVTKSTNNKNFDKPGTSTSIQKPNYECQRVSIKNAHLLPKAFESSVPQIPRTSSKPARKSAEKLKLIPTGPNHKYSAFSKSDSSAPSTETERSKSSSKESGQS